MGLTKERNAEIPFSLLLLSHENEIFILNYIECIIIARRMGLSTGFRRSVLLLRGVLGEAGLASSC